MPKAKQRAPGSSEPLTPQQEQERAREAALRLLSARERSAAELRLALRRKGYTSPAIEAVIGRLQETGLQDDRRFARMFAEQATGSRAWATRRVQNELRFRGVDREVAAAAAAEPPEAEEERARTLARSRAARLSSLEPRKRFDRIFGLLARRGYDAGICRRVATEAAGLDAGETWDAE